MPLSTIVQLYYGGHFQLVGETVALKEHHRPAECHCQKLSHNFVSSTSYHGRNLNNVSGNSILLSFINFSNLNFPL